MKKALKHVDSKDGIFSRELFKSFINQSHMTDVCVKKVEIFCKQVFFPLQKKHEKSEYQSAQKLLIKD